MRRKRRFLVSSLILLVFLVSLVTLGCGSASPSQSEPSSQSQHSESQKLEQPQQSTAPSMTVYITKTGEKYHRDGCQYLAKSKIAISLDDAKARGYGPCSKCKPPQ